MSEGILVRAWRYLFGRDVHADCRRAVEHERLARQWERENNSRLLEKLQDKALEMADPGINYRFSKPTNNGKERPIKVDPKPEVQMMPGLVE